MKPYFFMTSLVAAALIGCAQNGPTEQADTTRPHTGDVGAEKLAERSHATIKPGAAISFSHEFEEPLIAGEQGQVILTITEAYTSGVLNVEVSVDQGLSVFGASVSKTIQLSDGPDHTWPITVSAVKDGVQYLRIRAVTDIQGQPASARSYAVRIEVGDGSDVAAQKASPITTMPDGDAVIMLDAEETSE